MLTLEMPGGGFDMPVAVKAWAAAHVFTGFVSGTLGVYVADQGVINEQTTITLFAAIGFAAFSFGAGWRLSSLVNEQRVKRAQERGELMEKIGELEKSVDSRFDAIERRMV